jgi:quercetin dioxygenase-like cupin family protein
MKLEVRRVVTGHDDAGRARVASDDLCDRKSSARPGHERLDLWKDADGTVFRLVRYAPGVAPRHHRTETVDYAIVLEGEIHAVLDEDETVLRAGDVLIQRGTNHAWANRSAKTARVAFVLIDARR